MPPQAKAKLPDGTWYYWDEPEEPFWAKKDPALWEMSKKELSQAAQTKAREKVWKIRIDEKLTEQKKLQAAFTAFDKDGSGKLERDEMKMILTRANSSGNEMTEADADEFMKIFDVNEDGVLDIKEFIEAMKAMQANYVATMEHGDDAMIKDDIEYVDTDGDGKLTFAEFSVFEKNRVEIQGKAISDQELTQLFKELDKDGSGSIELKELIARRVAEVSYAKKEDAEEMAENLAAEGGLGVVASGSIKELADHAHNSGLGHGEIMA